MKPPTPINPIMSEAVDVLQFHVFHETDAALNSRVQETISQPHQTTLPVKVKECPLEIVDMSADITDDTIQLITQDLVCDHKDEFKQCVATYNIEDGTQAFETIALAISSQI